MKTFPVNSTAVETSAAKRVARVLARRPVSDIIAYAGCYNCRKVSGSSTWSQHSWGNALDLFPEPSQVPARRREAIRDAVVYQATHRTVANRFIKLPVSQVIDHDGRKIWTPEHGWQIYTGTTGNHVHVSGAPYKTGVPPCG